MVYVLFFFSSSSTQLIPNRQDILAKRDIHIRPFYMIGHYIEKCTREEAGFAELVEFSVNVLGNIFLFLPMGILIPAFLSNRKVRWLHVFFLTAVLSLATEFLQISFRVGNFDIDDILLNSLGSTVGYFLFRIIQYYYPSNKNYQSSNQASL